MKVAVQPGPGVRFQSPDAGNSWDWLRKRRNVTFVRAADEIDECKERFHLAIGSVLRWTRIFGVFPLSAVAEPDPKRIQFRWLSLPVLLSLLVSVGGYLIMGTSLVRLSRIGFTAVNVAEPIFYGMCSTLILLFGRVAAVWRELMVYWGRREELFFARPYGAINLRGKILTIAGGVLVLAFVEHVGYIANQAHTVRQEYLGCRYNTSSRVRLYAMLTYRSVFHFLPYHPLLGAYFMYVTSSLVFLWNFADLFIMLLSSAIAFRFGQLNKRIAANLTSGSLALWAELRAHYVGLMELTEQANRAIGLLLLGSCGNDMYFLCYQTLNTLETNPFPINDWYFRYSFAFIVLRTNLKVWFMAQVNENSMRTQKLVQTIRSEQYNDELEILRICSRSGAAISGLGLFDISRKSFLTLASVILTYELVLMRFHTSPSAPDDPCDYVD